MTTSRREVLGALAALGLAGRVPLAQASGEGADALRVALAGLPIGERFVDDWVLLDAYPPVKGGLTLVIGRGTQGRPLRVDVVRRGDPVLAAVSTDSLELFTMDGGEGVGHTTEAVYVALEALADGLEAGLARSGLGRHLLTHAERLRRYPRFMSRAACELSPDPEPEGDEA